MKKIMIVLLSLFIQSVSAGRDVSRSTTITSIYTYGNYGDYSGDLVVNVASAPTGCNNGFFIPKADLEANKNMAAMLLSAFHANATVYFAGYTDQVWAGTNGGVYCKAHTVGLVK